MEMMVAMVQSRDAQRRHLAGGHIGGPTEPPKHPRRRREHARLRPVRRVRGGLSRAFVALGRAIEPRPNDRQPACSPTS